VGQHAIDRGRDDERLLRVEEQSGVAQRLRYRTRRVGDDREVVEHRLEQRHAEAFVLAAHDEHVAGS
jgi:hypothetical protein